MCNNLCACLLVCSLILLVNCLEVQEPKRSALNRRALVRPVVHHARTKRQLTTTRQETGSHHTELLVKMDVEGEPYTLDLKLNHHLLPEGHTIRYQEGGKSVQHKPKKEEIDLCQYTGHIRGKPNSWAALSTCHGLRGAINDGTRIRYIEPSEGNDLQSLHHVYEQGDIKTKQRCGNDDLFPHKNYYNKLIQMKELTQENNTNRTRHKRETSYPIRGGPFNANERSRYVELVLVADYALYQGVNGTLKRLYRQLQESTNVLHAIYAPLNIFIALTGVEVWTAGDQIDLSRNSSITLDNFMQYRREVLLKHLPRHDHAQLITATVFDEGVVGKAYVSKMGSQSLSGAIIFQSAREPPDTTATAAIMAHEMGHSFGMGHDTEASACPVKYCIMHRSAVSPIPTHFSKTSLQELMMGFHQGLDYSLRNKPKKLFGAPSCGNGFVDPGEECDCGVTVKGIKPNGCHRCCNPNTCRLRTNATCATGACCNFQTCRLKPVATLCRPADRECDLPEYCTGDSEHCPEDVFKMDTTPCSDKAYCVQGQCRSHDTQCRLLWGSAAKNGQQDCYEKNKNGDQFSNCGYDFQTRRSKRCGHRDVSCGRLYCHHYTNCNDQQVQKQTNCDYNSRLGFGYSTRITMNFFSKKDLSLCDVALIDTVSSVDPGMVPDGAECGAGRMCLRQQCVSVDDVRTDIIQHSEGCRANCSGHGICNSKGKCHCDAGFAPPLCDLPGVGGSDDSGPAGDPNVQKIFKLVMYIIFLGIVPLIALILLLIYFMKRKSRCEQNTNSHRSISSATTVKKAILSLFNAKDKNIKSTNTSTVLNRNLRPEPVKNTAEYDIEIIRDVQAEVALQSKFDINSYVNYRNGTDESVMKITKEDIKVILSGTVEDLPKPLSNDYNNVNKNHLGGRIQIEHKTIDEKLEHIPHTKLVNNIKSTHLAIPTKYTTGNAYNAVSITDVKQNAAIRDDLKGDFKQKPIYDVKLIPHSKPIINQSNNFKPKAKGNNAPKPHHILLNEGRSNNIPSNHAIANRPIEAKTAPVLQTVKQNADTNIKPKEKVFAFDKPIPQKPTNPNLILTKGPKPTKEVNKVVSENPLERWPKLKPVKNSPVRNNFESSSEITKIEISNEIPKGGLKVQTMKNFFEDL